MKKKIIERNVFVGLDDVRNFRPKYMSWNNGDSDCFEKEPGVWVKAKLIIEVPEKKIEITESQFEKAFDEALETRGMCKAFYPELKQKLFGAET